MHLQMQGDGSFYTNTATYPFTENDQVLRLGPGTLGGTPADGSDTLVWAPHAQGVSSQSYETAPLSNGATIAGPIVATVYASSTNSNLQFATTLTDVDPSGKAVEISHGALVGSLSDLDPARTWSNQDGTVIRAWPLLRWDDYHTPNAVQKYEINIYTELYRVAPGHRLELTLATQYGSQDCASQGGIVGIPYGCYDNKPQTQTLTGGIYAVERTAQYPSALNLPLLPYHAFQPVPAGPTPTSGGTLVPQDWG